MDKPQNSDPSTLLGASKQEEIRDKLESAAEKTVPVAAPMTEEPKTVAPMPAVAKKTDVFKVGDLVKATTRDPKENKAHATPFEGIVICFRGEGDNKTFTVRRIGAMKVAIERIFPLRSKSIENIKVIKSNPASRAKLYYLRRKRS